MPASARPAGGLIGSLVHAGVPEEHAHAYVEGVRRGGTLVSVRGDDSLSGFFEEILAGRQAQAVDLETRRADYRTGGWEQFDETRAALHRPSSSRRNVAVVFEPRQSTT